MIDRKILIEAIVNEAVRMWNTHFIQESIKEWDKGGEGYFRDWIEKDLRARWREMARYN